MEQHVSATASGEHRDLLRGPDGSVVWVREWRPTT